MRQNHSDLPGQIIAQVREEVYDSATGRHLLVPPEARLISTYDSTVTLGQYHTVRVPTIEF
ncbi:TrbI/VirB10 family protein [Xenorhabdus hominickii]|uniref:Bacterial conjugation TrbI-like protein n=1 Tax=Xenorhabdus hominickii TaxID=351679 RepID=A0A1V0M4A2_XENHO|nr:Bacterial conjugation TrbI-like protein [Xenorhabdus hominickii]PHM51518.1 conjugal transfer protein TrbI [Xenorhabdus hominickii]